MKVLVSTICFSVCCRMDRPLALIAQESEVHMEGVKPVEIEAIPNQFYQSTEQEEREEGKTLSSEGGVTESEQTEKTRATSPNNRSEAVAASGVDSRPQQSEGGTARHEVGGNGEGESGTPVMAHAESSTSDSKDGAKLEGVSTGDDGDGNISVMDRDAPQRVEEEREADTGVEKSSETSVERDEKKDGGDGVAAAVSPSEARQPEKPQATIVQEEVPSTVVKLSEGLKQSQTQVSAPFVATVGVSGLRANAVSVPMVTHVPVVKSGLKPINIQKEREKIALMSAEKLTVSQVEMLSGREPRQVEIHSMLRGPITVGDGGVMSARSPQVAIISPMLSGGGEMQHTVEGRGSSAGGSVDAKKHTSTVVIDLSQDDEEDSRKTGEFSV